MMRYINLHFTLHYIYITLLYYLLIRRTGGDEICCLLVRDKKPTLTF